MIICDQKNKHTQTHLHSAHRSKPVVGLVVVVVVVYLLITHLQNMHFEIQENRTHKAYIVHQQRPSITKE